MSAFDTLAFSEALEVAGIDAKLSRALAHAMRDVAMQEVASKADLREAVHTLTIRGFGGLAALAGILLAAFALLH